MLEQKYSFPRSRRIVKKKCFTEIFLKGTRRSTGPFLVHAKVNTIGFARIGLAVPKRTGNAVLRNLIKRRCREAFRLTQETLPTVDFVLTIRPHETLSTDCYAVLLSELLKR
jgi:ribonuclease P protein component|tara:strand:+ start:612 stop:947 length:336 start_codon:yes stop_codon:yes gene_type:complete